MAQTVLSLVLEARPQSAARLRTQIRRLREAEEATPRKYQRLRDSVPALHFMSLSVCDDDAYDPVFVLEANFDGPPGPFWAQLEAAIGPGLRDMLRCCKPPGNGPAELFAAVTAEGARAPIAPLLEACTVTPAVFHQGNRGLDRPRIEREGALFLAARTLADDPALRARSPEAIHADLRGKLLGAFPWLSESAPDRVGAAESLADWVRLLGFAAVVVAALATPGLATGLVFPTALAPLLLVLATACAGLRVRDLESAAGRWSVASGLAGAAALLVLAANLGAAIAPGLSPPLAAGAPLLFWPPMAILGVVTVISWLLVWLRLQERADPSHDAPRIDPGRLRRIARSEDQTAQNHMVSIVHVKPGALRAAIIRAGLWGLGLVLRVKARDGYLGGMRTIHFAHWALIGDGGRLMFHSNFDSSWESYLDDFIEKAHGGLTLAWTNGVGFPRTRFLVGEGATHGRQFKAWARHSMTESLFWFSAYKDFTVNQIERNARLAQGLARPSLNPQEVAAWLLDL